MHKRIVLVHAVAVAIEPVLTAFRARWPAAEFRADEKATAETAARIFDGDGGDDGGKVSLDVRGTNFQLKVWEGLLRIPHVAVVSYEHLAESLGRPRAARAVTTVAPGRCSTGHHPAGPSTRRRPTGLTLACWQAGP